MSVTNIHKSSGVPLCVDKTMCFCNLSQVEQFLFNEECTHTESFKTGAQSDKDTQQGSRCRCQQTS